MKKAVIFAICIMFVLSLALVIAEQGNGNGQGNDDNEDDDIIYNESQLANNSSLCNVDSDCTSFCNETRLNNTVQECECDDNKCKIDKEDDNETDKEDDDKEASKNKTKGDKHKFVPWQKRNESECPDDCECRGAVVSCETEDGKTMTIEAGRSGNVIVIIIDKTEVETELEIETESENNKTKIKVKLKNNETRELKIMPNEAKDRIREQVRICAENESSCTAELKEIRNKIEYEFEGEKESKMFALFKKQMKIQARVDAETGDTKVEKPWWAFLASE